MSPEEIENVRSKVQNAIEEQFPNASVEVEVTDVQNVADDTEVVGEVAETEGERISFEDFDPSEFIEMMRKYMSPESHPIIAATLAEFQAIDKESDEFGEHAQGILGTGDFSVPQGLFDILDEYLPIDVEMFTDGESGEFDGDGFTIVLQARFHAALVAFVAGYQFAKKNGAAPVAEQASPIAV